MVHIGLGEFYKEVCLIPKCQVGPKESDFVYVVDQNLMNVQQRITWR